MFSTSTAEAGAHMSYHATSTYTEYGRVVVRGYFYNSGDTGGTVTRIELNGTAGGVSIYCNFYPKCYVAAGDRVEQVFTIDDGNVRSGWNVNLKYSIFWT